MRSDDSLKFTQILDFYRHLQLSKDDLPEAVGVLNPYREDAGEVWRLLKLFYKKFYNDTQPRGLILGINPGRMGAGLTGIPFTDAPALKNHCEIDTTMETREVSAEFVYRVIEAYGGPAEFFKDWFIGAVSPLGFIRQKTEKRWVNYNYYDSKALEEQVRPFIDEQMLKQKNICEQSETAVVLGSGKNYQYMQKRNTSEHWFADLIPLEHPRYIMQYRRKKLDEYVKKFVDTLRYHAPSTR